MSQYVFVPPSWSEVSDIITALATVASVCAAAYAVLQANKAHENTKQERQAEALSRRRTAERKIVPVLYQVLFDVRAAEKRLTEYAESVTYGTPSAEEFRLPSVQRLFDVESNLDFLAEDNAGRILLVMESARVYEVELSRCAPNDPAINPTKLVLSNPQVLMPHLVQIKFALQKAMAPYETEA